MSRMCQVLKRRLEYYCDLQCIQYSRRGVFHYCIRRRVGTAFYQAGLYPNRVGFAGVFTLTQVYEVVCICFNAFSSTRGRET